MSSPVPVARRQRAEQQRSRDTRAKILEAAVDCLVSVGHSETTTVLIQQRAGVSRGSLLHHFSSREALLVAAGQHLVRVRMREMSGSYAGRLAGEVGGPERVRSAVTLMWETFQQPYFWAAIELWVAARNDASLREILAPQERSLGGVIRGVLDEIFGAELCENPDYPDVRDLLFTSMRGVALTYAFEPRDPASEPHLRAWTNIALRMLGTTGSQ